MGSVKENSALELLANDAINDYCKTAIKTTPGILLEDPALVMLRVLTQRVDRVLPNLKTAH